MPDQAPAPLKSGQAHVGVVLLWYPLFTQPFIFSELETLSRRMPVEIYTLYGKNLRHCSEAMKKASERPRSYGAKSVVDVCWQVAKQSVKTPRRMWRLFKRSLWRKWPSWETFGENLWGFCVGVSLGKQFKEDGIDFVYSPWPRGAATAAWVGATLAGLPFGVAARGDNLAPADPDLGAKLEAATVIRANNAADQKRIESFDKGQAKGKTELIYNSLTISPDLAKNGDQNRFSGPVVRLLSLGRFDVTKGFDVLLKACALLKKSGFPFQLTLAGGGGKLMGLGGLESGLRSLRESLGLESEVDMPGLISHDQLPELLASHDIFLAPCVIDKSGRRDGIPNTVIEALAYGMPVISTNINALPEVVKDGETGLSVPPNDPQALASAIKKLAADPDLARKLGQNGAALAASLFDPLANAERFANMFNRAHARSKGEKAKCAA